MNQPTPAIVAQTAVRRLPRIALLLFCVAYVLPGFFGREPWKSADMTAFGYMRELASAAGNWLHPQLLGQAPELQALLPYWLGAWAIQWLSPLVDPALAVRIPYGLLLALTLVATWYGTYYLARTPRAQPVPFAFGGEADPVDYARAIADAGVLALIACLGLAQLSHETTPASAQLAFCALAFFGVAATPFRVVAPAVSITLGLAGLVLCGAPTMAVALGAGSTAVCLFQREPRSRHWALAIGLLTVAIALLALMLDLWAWRIALPQASWKEWRGLGRLLLWFLWPAWPLALWTLWRWRRQLTSSHVAIPLWFAAVAIGATLTTQASDRSLLLALPAMAALAAFALPTLRRSVASLVDWFTLLFFTGCAFVIWVVWIAMQTGVPPRPAANVQRLLPGFEPSFSLPAFAVALVATLVWAWLVKWRVGRHRAAIWKSLVLPAGGAALSWLLLMTLWLPLLDFARSYAPLARKVSAMMDHPACVQVHGLSRGQVAAFRYHGNLVLEPAAGATPCPYLIVDADAQGSLTGAVDMSQWTLQSTVRRPSDDNEDVLLYRRVNP